jgi:hypothetical protein
LLCSAKAQTVPRVQQRKLNCQAKKADASLKPRAPQSSSERLGLASVTFALAEAAEPGVYEQQPRLPENARNREGEGGGGSGGLLGLEEAV